MRETLGKPLCNIPISVLNKMVSRDVANSLRKFKLNPGGHQTNQTKRSKSKGETVESPVLRAAAASKSTEDLGGSNAPYIRKQLREIDSGIADRTTLLKMLVLRCDEADKSYSRIKNGLASNQRD
jgi:hypothetical protein